MDPEEAELRREGGAGPRQVRVVRVCEELRETRLEKLTQALSVDWRRFKGSREGTGRKWGGGCAWGCRTEGLRAGALSVGCRNKALRGGLQREGRKKKTVLTRP